MSESEHRMIEILRILNEQDKPTGSKLIADETRASIWVSVPFDITCRSWMRRDIPKGWDIQEGASQILVVKS